LKHDITSIEIAEEVGFTLKETLYQLMRNFPGRDQSNQGIKKADREWIKFHKNRRQMGEVRTCFCF
jgi:hypothetical protein